jgi:ribosomal protein L40E
MESENPELEPGSEAGFERIDADAVCEKCATVNPPDTLLCRACGNNLRDQRRDRLVLEHAAEAVDKGRPRRIMSVLLTIFGFLLIVWTMMNVNNIESWLAEGVFASEASDDYDPGVYWSSDESAVFEELLRQLEANPVTMEQANMAVKGPHLPPDDYTGRYVIWRPGRPVGRTPNQAYARQVDDEVRFVALVGRGGRRIEVRGKAEIEPTGVLNAKLVGFTSDDGIEEGYGFADPNETNGLDCYGRTLTSNDQITATLHFVP